MSGYRFSMSKRLLYLLFFVATLPGIAQANLSDLTCDDSVRLNETLTDVMGAKRQGQGLRGPGTVLEVWVKARTGDFMIVQNYANGTSCIVALGEHWEATDHNPA
jgi:hypothetical protein